MFNINKKNQIKPWFRPKSFGYGVTPCSWEGWIATFLLITVILLLAALFDFFTETGPTTNQIIFFMGSMFFVTFLFLWRMEPRVKGEVKWNWGKKIMKK